MDLHAFKVPEAKESNNGNFFVKPPPKKQQHNPLDAAGTYMKQKQYDAALAKHFSESPTMKALYTVYKDMSGCYDLPRVALENQCDQQLNKGYRPYDMTHMSHETAFVIFEHDKTLRAKYEAEARFLGGLNPEVTELDPGRFPLNRLGHSVFALKKFLLERDYKGDDDDNATATEDLVPGPGQWNEKEKAMAKLRIKHKRESARIGRELMEHYTNAQGVLALWEEAIEKSGSRDIFKNHIHDMTDAMLGALANAMLLYRGHAQTILGRRRPRDPFYRILTEEQRHQGGTIRVLYIDPGTRAIGVCLLELVELQVVPPEFTALSILRGDDWVRGDPEPCFRILLMELVDLESPWSDTRGHSVYSYHPWPLESVSVMRPDYMTDNAKLEDFFPVEPAPEPKKKKRVYKKRKRVENDEEASDPIQGPGKGRRTKRLKRMDGTPLAIEQEKKDTTILIDLTEENNDNNKE